MTRGETVAEVYGDSEGGKKERADALYREIEALEAALANAENWQSGYRASYESVLTATSAGMLSPLSARKELAAALSSGSVNKEEARAAAGARLEELRAEIAALVRFEGEPMPVRASADGRFYREIDGFEAFFGTEAAKTLSPEGFAEQLKSETLSPRAVGKLIASDLFYLVVPLSAAEIEGFTVGASYPVSIGEERLTLALDRIALSEDGTDALLVFCGEAALDCSSRRVFVAVERAALTGIAVPEAAIDEKDGVCGVWIDDAGRAAFRKIEILYRKNGICLAAPVESEGYLQAGDAVVYGNRRLSEGKVLS